MILNLIAMVRAKQKDTSMKTFRTTEELVDFVNNPENIETLNTGEITLKDWSEDFRALQKYWKEREQTASDRKAWESQREESSRRVAEMQERLDSSLDELTRLKEIHCGDDKEVNLRLNADLTAARAKILLMEKQNARIPGLQKKVDEWNASRILEAVKRAAVARKVPQYIIDDPIFFEQVVVDDFIIDDDGNIYTKGDSPLTADAYIATKQKDRPHWMPRPQEGTGNEQSPNGYVAFPDDVSAIASLFRSGGSSTTYSESRRGYAHLTDDEAAIAALFG
jgi:hypothetical protein